MSGPSRRGVPPPRPATSLTKSGPWCSSPRRARWRWRWTSTPSPRPPSSSSPSCPPSSRRGASWPRAQVGTKQRKRNWNIIFKRYTIDYSSVRNLWRRRGGDHRFGGRGVQARADPSGQDRGVRGGGLRAHHHGHRPSPRHRGHARQDRRQPRRGRPGEQNCAQIFFLMLQNIFANYSSRLTVVLLHTIHVPPIADRDQRGIRGPGAVLPEGAGLPHGEVQHVRWRRGARTPAGRVRSQDLCSHVGCCLITCCIPCLITCCIPCLITWEDTCHIITCLIKIMCVSPRASWLMMSPHRVHKLRRTGQKYGIGSACIGGGQGIAILFEKMWCLQPWHPPWLPTLDSFTTFIF